MLLFRKESTRWLGVRLESWLNFSFHINKRKKKAKAAEAQIKGLNKTYGLCPKLVQKIKIVVLQSMVLYRAKLW